MYFNFQAFGLSHDSQENYIQVASFVGLAIWMVMLLECTIKIIVKSRAVSFFETQVNSYGLSSQHLRNTGTNGFSVSVTQIL